jgi:hypothetical protein
MPRRRQLSCGAELLCFFVAWCFMKAAELAFLALFESFRQAFLNLPPAGIVSTDGMTIRWK